MTTGTELSTLLTTYLHNDVSLSAADKLLYLNLGQKRIVRDAPTVLRKKSGTLSISVAGDREYSLASDFYMMSAVWIKSVGIKLFPMGPSEFIDDVERMPTIASSYPTGYIILGYDESQDTPSWRIKFNKTPDTDYTVYYWYYYFPPVITAGSTPVISSIGYDELLLWASAMIALQPKDPEGFKIAYANYQANLESFSSYIPVSPDYTPVLREESNLRSIQRVQVISGYDLSTALADSSDTTLGDAMIGYKASGTGAVARTVHSRFTDFAVSVKDYGATGDGTTDDTEAIQEFLDECKDRRGYIPAGVYKITSALNLYPQYSYNIGGEVFKNSADAGTVIYNAGTGNAISLDNEPYTPPNYDSQIRIANLTVSGNSGSAHGIAVYHAMIYLENVWITGHGQHGLYLERAYGSSFRQVTSANNYMDGVHIYTAGNLLHFDHCVFNGNGRLDGYSGVRLTSIPDALGDNFVTVFTACDFTGNGSYDGVTTGYGAVVQRSYNASFIGCYWEGNKSQNIYADSTAKNLTVSGCYFQDMDSTITGVDGLVYENNFHLQISESTQISVVGGMPDSRLAARMFGNTYYGSASSNPTAGVTENIQLWYSTIPTGGTWKRGDIVWNSLIGNGGGNLGWVCINPGTPGDWLSFGQIPYVYTNWTDSDATLTPFASYTTNIWKSPLTTNRTVTLVDTGVVSGVKFRCVRTAASTGVSVLDVGGLKSMDAGQWCEVEWDGTEWVLTAFGSL